MANTTWSLTDNLNMALSGANNLTATNTGSGGVRSIAAIQAGAKLYWEVTVGGGFDNGNCTLGIQMSGGNLSSPNSSGSVLLTPSGEIFAGGNDTGNTLGFVADGDVIGIAYNIAAALTWFRIAPSGQWNGSTGDPAAGSGGVSYAIASPHALFNAIGGTQFATANFGDAAFSGTPPNGFTRGFPDGLPTARQRAMILA